MDATIGSAVALAGLAVLAAVLVGVGWRGERGRRAALEQEVARLGEELARARQEARARAGRDRGEELAALRRKLEKARRRAFAAQEERRPLEARAAEAETRVREREAEIARLRGELEGLAARAAAAAQEAERLRAQLDEARRQAAAARIDPEEHRSLGLRAAAAEAEVRRLGEALREAAQEASRWRQRERVQRRAYTVLRGELEVAKDRVRELTGSAAPPP